MDRLRAAARANTTVTIDMRANDKDRVRVDVVWNQESVSDPRHYVGIWYRFNLTVSMCIYTDMYIHAYGPSPTANPR